MTIEEIMQKLQQENNAPVVMRDVFDNLESAMQSGKYLESALYNRNIYNEATKMEQEDIMLAAFEALAQAYAKIGKQSECEELALKAMQVYDNWGSGSKTAMDTALLNYAAACLAFGRAQEAMPYIENVEERYGRLLDENDHRMIFLYLYKARALAAQGRTAEAGEYYGFAKDVLSRVEGFEKEKQLLQDEAAALL